MAGTIPSAFCVWSHISFTSSFYSQRLLGQFPVLSVSGPTLVLPVVFIPTDYWDYSHRILASDAKNFDVIPFITYTHIDSSVGKAAD